MRSPLRNLLPVASALAAALWLGTACVQILGIGDPQLGSGQGGSAGSGGTVVGGSGGASAGNGGQGGTGGSATYPCTPTGEVCTQVPSDCLALVDNASREKQGFRIQHVTMYQPEAFASDTVEGWAILNAITMNLPDCQLEGSGTLDWLIELDTTSSIIRVGAAKPVADPTQGYTFVDETIDWEGVPFVVTPRSILTSIGEDGTIDAETIDQIVLPIYLDQAATQMIMMPIHQLRIYDAKLSADHNCIGHYNAEGLDPGNNCKPDEAGGVPAFIDGAKTDGYITLEEADQVIITAFGLNRSLCVELSGDAGTWGDGGSPVRCERESGAIRFPGDWCSATNGPADGSCFDAMRFDQGIAAAAIQINP